jgi:ribosomal protein S27AE
MNAATARWESVQPDLHIPAEHAHYHALQARYALGIEAASSGEYADAGDYVRHVMDATEPRLSEHTRELIAVVARRGFEYGREVLRRHGGRYCPRCGAVPLAAVSRGSGPHFGRLSCAGCGGFLTWLPKPGRGAR